MSEQPAEPELERRPHLALAAKLLVALGFAIVLLVLRGQAADAVGRPVGPVGPDRVTDACPVRGSPRPSAPSAAPVVQVSPRVTTAAPRSTEAPARPRRADRAGAPAGRRHRGAPPRPRPRPRGPRRRGRTAVAGPRAPDPGAAPVAPRRSPEHRGRDRRRQPPSRPTVLPPRPRPRASAPAVAEPGSATTIAAAADRSAEAPHEPSAPIDQAPRLPLPDGTDTSLPTGDRDRGPAPSSPSSPRSGSAVPRKLSLIVHAAQRRVPVAPALRPSFTPD